MQGFLYYLPGVQAGDLNTPAAAKEKLGALGLGHLELAEFPRDGIVTPINLFGSSGVMLIPNTTGGPPDCHRYEPARQTWIEWKGFWIGVCNDDLPHPELIRRKTVFEGYVLNDPSGREWHIPVARSHRGQTSIPDNIRFDPSGKPIAVPKAEFAWLWELSGKLFDHWSSEEPANRLTVDFLLTSCVSILGINYKVSFAEVSVLCEAGSPVVDVNFAQFVGLFAVDNPLREQFQEQQSKKNSTQAANG